jgi:hypothetical protein
MTNTLKMKRITNIAILVILWIAMVTAIAVFTSGCTEKICPAYQQVGNHKFSDYEIINQLIKPDMKGTKKRFNNPEVIKSTCVFLKLLYEETKDYPRSICISGLAKEGNIPYYNNISQVLCKKGIITSKGHRAWLWATKTEPNHVMAEAILLECHNLVNTASHKTINNKPKTIVDHTSSTKSCIGDLITELQNKIVFGIPKGTRLDEDNATIIMGQIKGINFRPETVYNIGVNNTECNIICESPEELVRVLEHHRADKRLSC